MPDEYCGDPDCAECNGEDYESDDYEEGDEYGSTGIHSWDYVPLLRFYGDGGEVEHHDHERLYFGVELEIECGDDQSRAEIADGINHPALYCKGDGSLRYGFEIVSHPATLGWWRNHNPIPFARLKELNCRSYQTDTCGMHVHVSASAVSPWQVLKLMLLFSSSPEQVLRASRRVRANLNAYSAVERGNLLEFVHKVNDKNSSVGRYVAINMHPEETIEFRLFRGTLHAGSFQRNIELVNALLVFAELHSLQEMTWETFQAWLQESMGEIGDAAALSLSEWLCPHTAERAKEESESCA